MAKWKTLPAQNRPSAGSSPALRTTFQTSCARVAVPASPLGFQVLGSAGRNGGSRSTSRGFEPRNPNQLNAMNNPSDPSDLPGAPAPAPQSPPTAKDYAWFRACLYADGSMLVAHGDGTLLIDEKAPYG
jgi:hypothetical protein